MLAFFMCSIHSSTYCTGVFKIQSLESHSGGDKHVNPSECGFEDAGVTAFMKEADCAEAPLNVDVESKKVNRKILLPVRDEGKTQTAHNFFLTLTLTHMPQ